MCELVPAAGLFDHGGIVMRYWGSHFYASRFETSQSSAMAMYDSRNLGLLGGLKTYSLPWICFVDIEIENIYVSLLRIVHMSHVHPRNGSHWVFWYLGRVTITAPPAGWRAWRWPRHCHCPPSQWPCLGSWCRCSSWDSSPARPSTGPRWNSGL